MPNDTKPKANLDMVREAMKYLTVTDLYGPEGREISNKVVLIPEGSVNSRGWVVTKEDLEKIAANLNNNVRPAVQVDRDHSSALKGDTAAIGWVVGGNVEYRPELDKYALCCTLNWNSEGTRLFSNNIYRFFSAHWEWDYKDPVSGQEFGPVLISAAATNDPLMTNVREPFAMASRLSQNGKNGNENVLLAFNSNPMADTNAVPKVELKEIIKLDLDKLTAEHKAYITEHFAELDVEAQKKFASLKSKAAVKADAPKEAVKVEPKAVEKPASEPAKEEPKAKVEDKRNLTVENKEQVVGPALAARSKTDSDNVVLSAREVMALREEAAKAKLAMRTMEIDREFTDKRVLSSRGGQFKKADLGMYRDFRLMLNDKQDAAFLKLMDTQPTRVLAMEQGSDANPQPQDLAKKFDTLVEDKIAKLKVNRNEAIALASREDAKAATAWWEAKQNS